MDHAVDHGIEGLVTLIGVRLTTGRAEAARAVDLVFRKLGRRPPRCRTAATPVAGGAIPDVNRFVERAIAERPPGLTEPSARQLATCHGTRFPEVLAHARDRPALLEPLGSSDVIGAQVVHACREEIALTLGDVVFRRTDLATGWHPGSEALAQAAALAAECHGWSETRTGTELEAVEQRFAGLPRYAPRRAPASRPQRTSRVS